MKANIGAGADLDANVASSDNEDEGQPSGKAWLDLFGKLSIGINSLTAEMADARKREQRRLAHLPVNISLDRQSLPGAAVTDIQDFGGPQPGREWVVRLLLAIAAPIAANATVVTWYVGQVMPGPAAGQLPASMAQWQFASVPSFQNFTSDVIHIKPGEHLIAGLTGIPAASAIFLGASIDDQLLYDVNPLGR